MERYNLIKEVGNGTFGSVWRALNKQTDEIVAIKKMKRKYYSWEECINLREVKSLRKMNHPNVVKLKEVIRENDILYFVFEYMECNLYQLMKEGGKLFSEAEVRNWCFQVFQGLAYVLQRGYYHRDLKPENLLVSKHTIKIADFGLAREISSSPPYTEYVSTRWYRAPEVLLQSPRYGSGVDMWAMGAILAELLTLRPLFPGSSEADQIYKICSVLGSPSENKWAEGLKLANALRYQFPQLGGIPLSTLLRSASKDAVDLITLLCSWDPCKRPTASEVLLHPFFQSCYYVPPSLRPKATVVRTPPAGNRGSLEQTSVKRYSGTWTQPPGALSSPKAPSNSNTGVHRKLEISQQGANKYEKTLRQPGVKQPIHRPSVRNSTTTIETAKARGVSDTAEKLANMTISSSKQHPSRPPPMRAGGWNGHRVMLIGQSQDSQPGRLLRSICNSRHPHSVEIMTVHCKVWDCPIPCKSHTLQWTVTQTLHPKSCWMNDMGSMSV